MIAPAALATACAGGGGTGAGTAVHPGLTRVKSGLLADYTFSQAQPAAALSTAFELGGSAPASRAYVSAQSDGLHVGVREHARGTFEGYFAVTRAAYPASAIFHVTMRRPASKAVPLSQTGEVVFAVQTATTKQTGAINYVLVASVRHGPLVHWEAGYADGHLANARTKIAWSGRAAAPAATPLSQDVTLQTDGYHTFDVFFGDQLVYGSSNQHMNIVPPFQAYLEVQALERAYESRFQNFWVVAGKTVVVEGLKPRAKVTLAPAGKPEVSAVADAAGKAQLILALPEARGTGTFTIRSHGTSRSIAGIHYAGGDVYHVT